MTEINTESTGASPDKLWAGKYKTPEEMENALLSQNKEVYKLLDEKKNLAAQIQQTVTVPEFYKIPDGLEFVKHEIDDLKVIAKNAGLSQTLFEKMIHEMNTKKGVEHQRLEENKKAIGDANITVLDDYVKKNYPEKLHHTILSTLITDADARKQAMTDREKKLNSTTPGLGAANPAAGAPADPYDGYSEVMKLAKEYEIDPSNSKLKDKLIRVAAEVGEARKRQ